MSYILAVMLMLSIDTAPVLIGPMPDRETCMVEAEKGNSKDTRLHHPEARKLGAEYVCLKVERVTI